MGKEGEDLKQSGEKIDLELKPRTTHYYRVTVTGDQGDTAVSDLAYFETGKMQEAWEADWIAPQKGGCVPSGDRHESLPQ